MKFVYLFKEGNADMRNLLGGKGANLAEMTNLGLPIPQGFTVTTEACTDYYKNNETISSEIEEQIYVALHELEQIQGKTFGDVNDPLLVSVRSGARAERIHNKACNHNADKADPERLPRVGIKRCAKNDKRH